jgi:hypothetical protein
MPHCGMIMPHCGKARVLAALRQERPPSIPERDSARLRRAVLAQNQKKYKNGEMNRRELLRSLLVAPVAAPAISPDPPVMPYRRITLEDVRLQREALRSWSEGMIAEVNRKTYAHLFLEKK